MTTADYAAECEALAKELRAWVTQADAHWSGASLVMQSATALSRVPRLVAALREAHSAYLYAYKAWDADECESAHYSSTLHAIGDPLRKAIGDIDE